MSSGRMPSSKFIADVYRITKNEITLEELMLPWLLDKDLPTQPEEDPLIDFVMGKRDGYK